MRTPSTRALVLPALLSAALTACAAPVEPAAEEGPVAEAAQGIVGSCDEGAIRAEAPASAIPFLDRAFDWVHIGALYCQCVTAATSPYRADCSGLVSYAWGLAAPGHTTYSFAGGPWDDGQSVAISWDELAVGDALNFGGNPGTGVGHVMLFGGWLDAGHTQFCAIEESKTGTPAHVSQHKVTDPGSWWGGSGSFADIFLPIRLAGYAPTPPNQPPQGWLDAAACDGIRGWSEDPDAPDQAIDVHLYFDGNPGDPGAQAMVTRADQHRDDLCAAIGSCNHGYSAAPPRSLMDGQPHLVRAYGIDTAGGDNPLLAGSPQTMQCDPPAPPLDPAHGVKRWVTSPTVFDAWHFDWFRDLAHEPEGVVAGFPDGPDMPDAPVVVRADDGTQEVWVIDSGVRRHVVDPTSLGAWKLDSVVVTPAADVYKYPVGSDLPAAPFVFSSPSDPKVYVLDVPPVPPPVPVGTGGGMGSTSSSGGGGSASSGGWPGGPGNHGGGSGGAGAGSETPGHKGGCATAPGGEGSAGWVMAAIGLLALRRRRR